MNCTTFLIFTVKWKSLCCVRLFATPWTIQVHGILQARILEWVAFPFSRGSSQSRGQTQVSHIAGGFFTSWATREGPSLQYLLLKDKASAQTSSISFLRGLGFPNLFSVLSLKWLVPKFFLFPMVHIWVLGHTYDAVKLYSCSKIVLYGLPRWHSGKELPANTEDSRDSGLIPGSGRSSRVGKGILLQYSCLENPLDRGACRLQSMGSLTVRYHWAPAHTHTVYFMVP